MPASPPANRKTTSPLLEAAGQEVPRDALDPAGSLLRRRRERRREQSQKPRDRVPADDVRQLREGALRAGLPRRRNHPLPRRPQPDGLQPLRWHAILLQQLSLQGSPVQLFELLG